MPDWFWSPTSLSFCALELLRKSSFGSWIASFRTSTIKRMPIKEMLKFAAPWYTPRLCHVLPLEPHYDSRIIRSTLMAFLTDHLANVVPSTVSGCPPPILHGTCHDLAESTGQPSPRTRFQSYGQDFLVSQSRRRGKKTPDQVKQISGCAKVSPVTGHN